MARNVLESRVSDRDAGESGAMLPDKKPKSRSVARASSQETAGRVETIVGMMSRGEWRRGRSGPILAQQWGLTPSAVERYTAEASRELARRLANPERVKAEVTEVLMANLHRASDAEEYRAVASLGDVVTKIVGARAPERHEHAHLVAQYDAMAPAQRAQWCRDKAKALLEEAERLEAESVPAIDDAGEMAALLSEGRKLQDALLPRVQSMQGVADDESE